MAPPLIQLKDIRLTFGGTPLLSGVELNVAPGERVCLIGRNGSGKSTLLKIAAGLVEPDSGTRFVQPGATVRYLPQEPDFGEHKTTLAYVESGLAPGDDHHQARYLLEQLGLTGDENPHDLSGGEARRAALACVLAPSPDILLLDEPTNHLDLSTIEWLEQELDSRRSALVLISHDRRFLTNLSRSTAWLDRGRIKQIDRGFASFETWRDEVLAEEERDQHKLDRKIVDEEHWLRHGVSGRRKRNVKRLANLHALRAQRRNYRGTSGSANLAAAEAEQSGKLVIEAKGISKAYGERKIVENFSTRIQRGDRLGIIGPNGAGKTTVFNCITGFYKPSGGAIRLAHDDGRVIALERLNDFRIAKQAKVARTFQNIRLFPGMTALENLMVAQHNALMRASGFTLLGLVGAPGYRDAEKRAIDLATDWLRRVNLLDRADDAAGNFAYGDQRRLEIARAMCTEPALLCLDEPAAGLNARESAALSELLLSIRNELGTSILLIEHDMSVVMEISDHIVVMDHGVKIAEGTPREVRDDPKVIAAYLGADEEEAVAVMESGT